jgi:hypothetical protein
LYFSVIIARSDGEICKIGDPENLDATNEIFLGSTWLGAFVFPKIPREFHLKSPISFEISNEIRAVSNEISNEIPFVWGTYIRG